MQLTGGQYKGRKITTPKGVRPTLSVVRESVFNALYSYFGDFSGKKFLDMFSGSGIMTFEAVSRGFNTLSFEINPSVIKILKENSNILGVNSKFILADSLKKAPGLKEKFDVIYADPPWAYSYFEIFQICSKLLEQEGLGLVECDIKKKPDVLLQLSKVGTLELFREKNYGRCCLLFVKLR